MQNTVIGQTLSVLIRAAATRYRFYLTYKNDGIISFQQNGSSFCQIEGALQLNRTGDSVTRPADSRTQTVDLYATQAGSYTGRLVIPSERFRSPV